MTYHPHDACHRWALDPGPSIFPSSMAVLHVCLGKAPFSFFFFFLARESGSQANASERASERASCLLDERLEARVDDTGSNRQQHSLTCTPRNVLILIIYTPFLFSQVAGFLFWRERVGASGGRGDVVS